MLTPRQAQLLRVIEERIVETGSASSTDKPWRQWDSLEIDPLQPVDELRRQYGADIDRMRADMAAGLQPAEPKALAVALGPFAHFAETTGLLAGTNWPDWARLYVENLRDLVREMIEIAAAGGDPGEIV